MSLCRSRRALVDTYFGFKNEKMGGKSKAAWKGKAVLYARPEQSIDAFGR